MAGSDASVRLPTLQNSLILSDICILEQVYYYIVDSPRNEGKDFFEISMQTGEIFTKVVFDREKQGAYALEVEARDGAPSARPNSDNQPNSDKSWSKDETEGNVTKYFIKLDQ
ncbi:Neural-cadherin [Papilio machaon]|uniref:Neural-cadherin n=1 Tax=Papilio machaon TaxID=76193 RepID=A0A194R7M1_PAPMA|nr:Neural-cadherin [Papilio machaon]